MSALNVPSEEEQKVTPKDEDGRKRRKKREDHKSRYDKDKSKESSSGEESDVSEESDEHRCNSKGKTKRSKSPPERRGHRRDDSENSDNDCKSICERCKSCLCSKCQRKRTSGSSDNSGSSRSSNSGSSYHSEVQLHCGQHITINAKNLYLKDSAEGGRVTFNNEDKQQPSQDVHHQDTRQHPPPYNDDRQEDIDYIPAILFPNPDRSGGRRVFSPRVNIGLLQDDCPRGNGMCQNHDCCTSGNRQGSDYCPPGNSFIPRVSDYCTPSISFNRKPSDYCQPCNSCNQNDIQFRPSGNSCNQKDSVFHPPGNSFHQKDSDYCPLGNSVSRQGPDCYPPSNTVNQQGSDYPTISFNSQQDYGHHFFGNYGGQTCNISHTGASRALMESAPTAMVLLCHPEPKICEHLQGEKTEKSGLQPTSKE